MNNEIENICSECGCVVYGPDSEESICPNCGAVVK